MSTKNLGKLAKDDLEKERVAVDRSLAGIVRLFHVPNLFYQYELLHDLPMNSIGKKLTVCFCIMLACLYVPIAIYYQSTTAMSVRKWDIGVEFESELAARGNDKSQFQAFVERRLRDKFTEVSRQETALTLMQCPCQGMDALRFMNFANIGVDADFCEPVPLAFIEFLTRQKAREFMDQIMMMHEMFNYSGTPVHDMYLKDPAKGFDLAANEELAAAKMACLSINETAPGCLEDNPAIAARTLCNIALRFAYVEAQNLLESWLPYSGELLTPKHWDAMQNVTRKTFVRRVKAQSQALREYGYVWDMVEQPVTMWNHYHRKTLQIVAGGRNATFEYNVSWFLMDFDKYSGKIGGRNEEQPDFCDWQTEAVTRSAHCSGVRFVDVLMLSNNKSLDDIDAMLASFHLNYGAYANLCWSKGHQCQWTEESKLTYLEILGALFTCLGSIILVARFVTSTVLVFFLQRPAQQEAKRAAKTSNESIETGGAEVPILDANDDCRHSSAGTACVGVEVVQTEEKEHRILSLMKEVEQLRSRMRDLVHFQSQLRDLEHFPSQMHDLEHRQTLLESRDKELQLRDESQDAIEAQQQQMKSLDAPLEPQSEKEIAMGPTELRTSKEYLMNLRSYV